MRPIVKKKRISRSTPHSFEESSTEWRGFLHYVYLNKKYVSQHCITSLVELMILSRLLCMASYQLSEFKEHTLNKTSSIFQKLRSYCPHVLPNPLSIKICFWSLKHWNLILGFLKDIILLLCYTNVLKLEEVRIMINGDIKKSYKLMFTCRDCQ